MRRLAIMLALIVAGELVFSLPFHTIRFFRPTFLDVFDVSNTQLGDLFAVYGVVAMLVYFPGGALADRYPPRLLVSASLLATAAGGFYMATLPGSFGLAMLYAWWGVTTIFLFWGAMLKVAREWGGETRQGLAFGLLDGGRGLVAVLAASLAIFLLTLSLPEAIETASDAERRQGLSQVILAYACLTAFAGALAWFLIPAEFPVGREPGKPLDGMKAVLRRPTLWAHAGVVIFAYSAFKGLDTYALYAVEVLGRNEVEGAELVKRMALLRPVAALAAGLLADRFGGSRLIAAMFVMLAASYALLATTTGAVGIMVANLAVTTFLAFGLRGVYFALMNENRTPLAETGATVGMVSFIGFTPEFFFAPIAGRILDANPGVEGHLDYFWFLAGLSLAGLVTTLVMIVLNRRQG